MNARQKAKYYKRKYEGLASKRVAPVIVEKSSSVVDLKLRHTYPLELIYGRSEQEMEDMLKDRLKRAISKDLLKYVRYHVWVDEDNNFFVVDAVVSVVERK